MRVKSTQKGTALARCGSAERDRAGQECHPPDLDALPTDFGPSEAGVFRPWSRRRAGDATGKVQRAREVVSGGAVGTIVVVQLDHRTPTGLMSVSFSIRGQADRFMSTRSLRRPASRHFVVA